MADRIIINNLHAGGLLGIYGYEQRTPRNIVINAVLYTDISRPAASDDIGDAIDYDRVSATLIRFAGEAPILLLERLAQEMARLVLTEFPAVTSIQLKVEKPGSLPFATSAAIEIERSRADFGL